MSTWGGGNFSTDRSQAGAKLKKRKSFLSMLNVFKWRKKKAKTKIEGTVAVTQAQRSPATAMNVESESSSDEALEPRRDSLMQGVEMDLFTNVNVRQPKPRRLVKPAPKERQQSLKPIPGSPRGSDSSRDVAPEGSAAGLTRWREFSSLHNVPGEIKPKDVPVGQVTPGSSKESLLSSEDDACKF